MTVSCHTLGISSPSLVNIASGMILAPDVSRPVVLSLVHASSHNLSLSITSCWTALLIPNAP